MKPQRLGRIRVSVEWLSKALSGNIPGDIIETNAPKDLNVLGFFEDHIHFYKCLWVRCESESFEPVEEGAIIPEYGPYTYKVKTEKVV